MSRETPQSEARPSLAHEPASGQKYYAFTFFRVDPAWRRLPARVKAGHVKAFLSAAIPGRNGVAPRIEVRAFSALGLKKDVDFFLWQIGDRLEDLQALAGRWYGTALGGYLSVTYSYLSMTKRSPYSSSHLHKPSPEMIGDRPARYVFVYPFVKTREWYLLPMEERMRMMKEHTDKGHEFPSVRINTSYSFGLDDQDFVLAFESDYPDHFLNLVQRLRESAASRYTARDTPMFVGEAQPLEALLRSLAGAGARAKS